MFLIPAPGKYSQEDRPLIYIKCEAWAASDPVSEMGGGGSSKLKIASFFKKVFWVIAFTYTQNSVALVYSKVLDHPGKVFVIVKCQKCQVSVLQTQKQPCSMSVTASVAKLQLSSLTVLLGSCGVCLLVICFLECQLLGQKWRGG